MTCLQRIDAACRTNFDVFQRTGIKLAEVFDAETFERKLRHLYTGYSKRYGDLLKYDVEEELKRFEEYRVSLTKYTVDAIALMKDAQDKNTEILIEGANALMLDIDYGTVRHLPPSRHLGAAIPFLDRKGSLELN